MQWIELSVLAAHDQVEEVVSLLGRYGQGGAAVEEREADNIDKKAFIVKAYVPRSRSFKIIRQEIEQSLSLLPFPALLIERLLKPEDWFNSLKIHFSIVEIGERLIIKPSWIQQFLPVSTRAVIELDPGAAFGTGLHPTTRLCLLRMEKHIAPGMSVFDLGTGSGILAIAAAKLGASSVLALDTDPVAVKAARSNARINATDHIIKVNRGTLSLDFQREHKEGFDLALANITAQSIAELAERFIKVLKPGGIFISSGISAQGLDEVLIRLSIAEFKLEAIDQQDQWYAVIASKP